MGDALAEILHVAMLYTMLLALCFVSASALKLPAVTTPPAQVSAQMSRRAVLAGALAVTASPLAASASLVGDKATLQAEEEEVKKLDAEINKERSMAFADEVQASCRTPRSFTKQQHMPLSPNVPTSHLLPPAAQ